MTGWLDALPKRERLAWGALLFLALAARLWALSDRPYHHDESLHGWFSHNLATKGEYVYDPVYHGPVQYYAVATTFRLLGDSDFTGRLPAALGGTLLVGMALLLRPRFGPRAAFLAGALCAFSPNLLYFTRFCREDVWSLLGTAGTFLFLDRWWRSRSVADLSSAALFAAVAFASKENFYVLLALMVPSAAAVFWEPGKGVVFWPRVRRLVDVLEAHGVAIAGALLLFFVVSELLYTVFLVHPESSNPALQAITYWWGQHKSERVGGPKTYYLPRLVQYELAILLPAFVWIGLRLRRLGAAERFLVAWALSTLAMYAWLGEKTPWLIVHQLLPFLPIAGVAWSEGLAPGRRVLRGALAVTGAASIGTALVLSFVYPALTPAVQRAESVVYVQSTPEIKAVAREVVEAAKAGANPAASVDGESAWPMSWYLRNVPITWGLPGGEKKPPVAIVDAEKADEAAAALGPGYFREVVPLRAWWVPEASLSPLVPSPKQLLTYALTRRPWTLVGAQDVVVFRKSPTAGGAEK